MNIYVIVAAVVFAIIGAVVGFMMKNAQVQKDIKEKEDTSK